MEEAGATQKIDNALAIKAERPICFRYGKPLVDILDVLLIDGQLESRR
jgi:hypothetical protein